MRILKRSLLILVILIYSGLAQAQKPLIPETLIDKFAQVLVGYSLDLQPGEKFLLVTNPQAKELNLATYKHAIIAGAHVFIKNYLAGQNEIFYKYANNSQLTYLCPVDQLIYENLDSFLIIDAPINTYELSSIGPALIETHKKPDREIKKIVYERINRHEVKWCRTVYPTNALAQEAGMSLTEYREFVFEACKLYSPDPSADWIKEGEFQREKIKWLKGKNHLTIKGLNIDLSLSIEGRKFIGSDGKYNFPDGEI